MTIEQFLNDLVVAIVPVIGAGIVALLKYAVDYLKVKSNNALVDSYLNLVDRITETTVAGLQQSTVDVLKTNGAFDLETAKTVKIHAVEQVKAQLGTAKVELGRKILGDLDALIGQLVESNVKLNKSA